MLNKIINLFNNLLLNPSHNFTPEINIVLEEIIKLNDKEILFNPITNNLLNLIETLDYDRNVIIALSIKQLKIMLIKYNIDILSEKSENVCPPCEQKPVQNEKPNIQQVMASIPQDANNPLFENGPYGKRFKDRSQYPPKGEYIRIQTRTAPEGGHLIIYQIDDEGYVISEDHEEIIDEVNYDYHQIYSETVDEMLNYNDFQQLLEENLLNDALSETETLIDLNN